jgi:hypothetical protein
MEWTGRRAVAEIRVGAELEEQGIAPFNVRSYRRSPRTRRYWKPMTTSAGNRAAAVAARGIPARGPEGRARQPRDALRRPEDAATLARLPHKTLPQREQRPVRSPVATLGDGHAGVGAGPEDGWIDPILPKSNIRPSRRFGTGITGPAGSMFRFPAHVPHECTHVASWLLATNLRVLVGTCAWRSLPRLTCPPALHGERAEGIPADTINQIPAACRQRAPANPAVSRRCMSPAGVKESTP